MDCIKSTALNLKADAIKLKGLAEKRILYKYYTGARNKIIDLKQIVPDFENVSQMLVVCDILCAADIDFPDYGIDWYWALQLPPLATHFDIASQYAKLVAEVKSVKGKFRGSASAIKFIEEAFSVLSDKAKKSVFDSKRSASRKGCMSLNSGMENCSETMDEKESDVGRNCSPASSLSKIVPDDEVFDGNNQRSISSEMLSKRPKRAVANDSNQRSIYSKQPSKRLRFSGGVDSVVEEAPEPSASLLTPELRAAHKFPDYVENKIRSAMIEMLSNLGRCFVSQIVQFKEQEIDEVLRFCRRFVMDFDSPSKFVEYFADFEKQVDSLVSNARTWEETKAALSKEENVSEEHLTLLMRVEESVAGYEAQRSLLTAEAEELSKDLDVKRYQCDSLKEEVEKLRSELVMKQLVLHRSSFMCEELEATIASRRKHIGELETSKEHEVQERDKLNAQFGVHAASLASKRKGLEELETHIHRKRQDLMVFKL